MVMKTSIEWWKEVKADDALFDEWLMKQYRGEVTAAKRIMDMAEKFSVQGRNRKVLEVIAGQERQHAEWVKELLESRGLIVTEEFITEAESRYWQETLPGIEDFATGSAVAAHAEKMRLDRIMAIAYDMKAPEKVRETFERILRDEQFHEKAFRIMSTEEALSATEGNHERGMQALGLVA